MDINILDSTDVANPQSRAVLQALASRSLAHISEQIKKVNNEKANEFIETHVIGYGHDSVLENADSVIVNLNGLSMVAAKAIEDTSRFKGTEASTRYINVIDQPFLIDQDTDRHFEEVQEKQRAFYKSIWERNFNYNLKRFEHLRGDGSEEKYRKAVSAKTFDIMRSLIPGGATTIVNWASDLRTVKDRITELTAHPSGEVVAIAVTLLDKMTKRYPSAFKNGINLKHVDHIAEFFEEYHLFDEDPELGSDVWANPRFQYQQMDVAYTEKAIQSIKNNYPSLQTRPRGCPAPRVYSPNFSVAGLIDYGSFRDIQRHRNGTCKIPLLTIKNGFEDWYLDNFSPDTVDEVNDHLNYVEDEILDLPDSEQQYLTPMGYRVPFLLDYSLQQMIYVAELRSSRHVHPTARNVALHIDDFMAEKLPFVQLHIDNDASDFHISRANHDITTKV